MDALREALGADEERLVPVWGDITRESVIDAAAREELAGTIDHIFHLAAVYDMNMTDAQADRVNNEGTTNMVALAHALANESRRKPVFHHMSSVAIAGADYEGVFSDDMFDVGQQLHHPYYRTKFQSEAIVRERAQVPWKVYRPGMVVGHSQTGQIDKIDGPYYFFPAIKTLRDRLPKWLPLLGIEGGRMPVVPVDYVVEAMVHIAHKRSGEGKAYFLIQPDPPTAGAMLKTFVRAAHGPDVIHNLPSQQWSAATERQVKQLAGRIPMAGWLEKRLSKTLGIPLSILGYINNRAVFDDANTRAALSGSGIRCPKLPDYAETLWRYWEMHIDCDVEVPADADPARLGPGGRDHRRIQRHRLHDGEEDGPGRGHRVHDRAQSGPARGDPRDRRAHGRAGLWLFLRSRAAGCDRRMHGHDPARSPSRRYSRSTTPGIRSAARCSNRWGASTTTNAPCSSTTSARSG